MCVWGAEDLPWETCGSVDAGGSRRTWGRLAFVLVVWIDGKFVRRFGNENSFAVQNLTESRWYIRIHYCPFLFLCDTSRNRWHHTEVAVSFVIAWLPPNHRNIKRHRKSFVIQPLRKICCTFMAAYVWGPGFVLVADLASEIQVIRLFHYRGDGLSLPYKSHFTANVTKLNGCGVHDGLMQYDATFWNLSKYFIFSRHIYLMQTSLRTQATGRAKSQEEAKFYP